LLARDSDRFAPSPAFYTVFQVDDPRPQVPAQVDVGGVLRLEGFDWVVLPVVRPGLEVQVTTYWRALQPLAEEYRFVFFFWDEWDRLALIYPEEQVLAWYPTWQWEPGGAVRVTLPSLPVGDVPHAGVAVLRPGFDPLAVEGRLLPMEPASGQQVSLREGGTVLELVRP
jgi:hypothetical protein